MVYSLSSRRLGADTPHIIRSVGLAYRVLAAVIPVEKSSSATFRSSCEWPAHQSRKVHWSPWESAQNSRVIQGVRMPTSARGSKQAMSATLHDRMAQARRRCTRRAISSRLCTSIRMRQTTFALVRTTKLYQKKCLTNLFRTDLVQTLPRFHSVPNRRARRAPPTNNSP